MIHLRTFTLLAAVAVPAALLASACSDDASLGRDRPNPLGNSGHSNAGSSGSSASSSGSANGPNSSGGSSGGSSGSSGAGNLEIGGSGSAEPCEEFQCVRAIECVEACGGPVLKASCCPCDAGTFDDIQCGSGGSGGSGSGPNLDELNTDCPAQDACSQGLTPVHFYGVAGEAGPEFCWCTIPCEEDPTVCPETTTCTATGDGPGTVCFAN